MVQSAHSKPNMTLPSSSQRFPLNRSFWLGVALAPLVTPFVAASLAPLMPQPLRLSFVDIVAYFPIIAIIALVYGYVGMAFLGLPALLALRRFGRLSRWAIGWVAFALGATLFLAVTLSIGKDATLLDVVALGGWGGGSGLAIGMAFWWIWRWTLLNAGIPSHAGISS
jgi:hypothetical protein